MSKSKFDPRSLLGKDLIQASGEAFLNQSHSIRVIRTDGKESVFEKEELEKQDPSCYDVDVNNGKITFVHIRPWNEHKPQ
jgi:hypothetical protein